MSDTNLPDRLKFIRRPLLVAGMLGTTPEAIHIYISDSLNRGETAVTLWHEIVHMLQLAGGHKLPETEEEIERCEKQTENYALLLAAAFPDIINWCLPNVTTYPDQTT